MLSGSDASIQCGQVKYLDQQVMFFAYIAQIIIITNADT